MIRILTGDAVDVLKTLPDRSVQSCITSPPYWGLRDYGTPGQLGLEKTPAEYVGNLVTVFREVRRVLRDDGVLWLNLGDSYAGSWGNHGHRPEIDGGESYQREKGTEYLPRGGWDDRRETPPNQKVPGLKPKDLVGIPWRVAFALQDDGWWLRSDIIGQQPRSDVLAFTIGSTSVGGNVAKCAPLYGCVAIVQTVRRLRPVFPCCPFRISLTGRA